MKYIQQGNKACPALPKSQAVGSVSKPIKWVGFDGQPKWISNFQPKPNSK